MLRHKYVETYILAALIYIIIILNTDCLMDILKDQYRMIVEYKGEQ